jgi:hypothetical protein
VLIKQRPPLAAVLALALALVLLGLGGWWWLQRQTPLALQQQTLQMPATARFLPRTANLSLYLELPPAQLPAYARAVAPNRRRGEAAASLGELRDGLFASAGLDYKTELRDWLGDDSGIALRAGAAANQAPAWVLALSSRSAGGGRQFLQRFWQARSLAGADLDISSYRGLGLISSRASQGGNQRLQPLATALVNDELVLLASSRAALEEALDGSQEDDLNQAGDPQLQQWLAQKPRGVALIRSDAVGLRQLLGLPTSLGPGSGIETAFAALRPQAAGLVLEVSLRGAEAAVQQVATAAPGAEALLKGLKLDPALLLLGRSDQPLPQLFQPQASNAGPLLAAIQKAGSTPQLLAELSDGDSWLLGTPLEQPALSALDAPLAEAGFTGSNLEGLRVWSKLSAKANRDGQLQANVAGASGIDTASGTRWWSNSLENLRSQLSARSGNGRRLQQLQKVDPANKALAALAMDGSHARELLSQWPLWRGLQLAAGRPLSPALRGLALALQEDQNQSGLTALITFR